MGSDSLRWSGAGGLGVRPQIDDVAELFRLVYRLGADAPHLVVLDEFRTCCPAVPGPRPC